MTPVRWLQLAFVLACVGAAVFGVLRARRPGLTFGERWLRGLVPVLLVLLIAKAAAMTPFTLYRDWSAARLAPAVTLARHEPLYYGPHTGPLSGWIYPPLAPICFLPAAYMGTPVAALTVAGCINYVLYFVPALLLFLRGARQLGQGTATGLALFTAFGFYTFASSALGYAAGSVHADGPALGMGALACAAVYQSAAPPGSLALFGSALAAVLAVWGKQTLAPIVVAIPAWLFLAFGWRTALRHVVFEGIAGLTTLAGFVYWFGGEAFYFNVFRVPAGHPWSGTVPINLIDTLRRFEQEAFPLVELLICGVYLSTRGWAGHAKGENWFRAHAWSLPAAVGVLNVVTCLMALVKVGGDINNASPALYFIAAAVILLAADLLRGWLAEPERAAAFVRCAVVFVAGYALLQALTVLKLSGDAARQGPPPVEMAYAYLKDGRHPDVYFPYHPLAHLMAQGKQYHFLDGPYSVALSGFAPSPEQFAAYVPPDCRRVCFSGGWQIKYTTGAEFVRIPSSEAFFGEFRRPVHDDGLPGWICYERGPASDSAGQ